MTWTRWWQWGTKTGTTSIQFIFIFANNSERYYVWWLSKETSSPPPGRWVRLTWTRRAAEATPSSPSPSSAVRRSSCFARSELMMVVMVVMMVVMILSFAQGVDKQQHFRVGKLHLVDLAGRLSSHKTDLQFRQLRTTFFAWPVKSLLSVLSILVRLFHESFLFVQTANKFLFWWFPFTIISKLSQFCWIVCAYYLFLIKMVSTIPITTATTPICLKILISAASARARLGRVDRGWR